MSFPFRFYGESASDHVGMQLSAFDVQFARNPTPEERRALGRAWGEATRTGPVEDNGVTWSERFAVFQLCARDGYEPHSAVWDLVHVLHAVVPLADAVHLRAHDGVGEWDAWSLAQGPPDPGPRMRAPAVCAAFRRPVDPTLPPLDYDPDFDDGTHRGDLELLADLMGVCEGAVGLELAASQQEPSAVRIADDPRFAGWDPAPFEAVCGGSPLYVQAMHPDGTRFLATQGAYVWHVDLATSALRPAYRAQVDDNGQLESAIWLDAHHFVVSTGNRLRVLREQGADAVEVASVAGEHRALHLGGGALVAFAPSLGPHALTVYGWAHGRLERIGRFPERMRYAGVHEGRVHVEVEGRCFALTGVADAVAAIAPPKPRAGGLSLAVEPLPAATPTAPAGLPRGIAVEHPSGAAACLPYGQGVTAWGLVVRDASGAVRDLTASFAALGPLSVQIAHLLAFSPDASVVFVAVGQPPLGGTARIGRVDLATGIATLLDRHDAEVWGKAIALVPESADAVVVVGAKHTRRLVRVRREWESAHARKHATAKNAAGGLVGGLPVVALVTDDGLLVLAVRQGKLAQLGKVDGSFRRVELDGARFVVEDGQRKRRILEGIDEAVGSSG